MFFIFQKIILVPTSNTNYLRFGIIKSLLNFVVFKLNFFSYSRITTIIFGNYANLVTCEQMPGMIPILANYALVHAIGNRVIFIRKRSFTNTISTMLAIMVVFIFGIRINN